MTLGMIIALTGGQATGLIGLITTFIGGYQGFAYNKSSVKRFYTDSTAVHDSTIDDESDDSDDNRKKMRKRLKVNSKTLSMNYFMY